MKKWILMSVILFAGVAFAQSADPNQDFLSDVMNVIKSFQGGIGTAVKVSAIIALIISSMKVSFLSPLWDKLGSAKVYVAPVLGLVAGLLGFLGPAQITWASLIAYIMTGGGAVFLHEILDSIKSIPGLGGWYLTVISIIEGALGGAKSPPQA